MQQSQMYTFDPYNSYYTSNLANSRMHYTATPAYHLSQSYLSNPTWDHNHRHNIDININYADQYHSIPYTYNPNNPYNLLFTSMIFVLEDII